MTRRALAVFGMLLLAPAAVAQFTQQGGKLVGTGAIGASEQGFSVAVSTDGTTAIVGGHNDNGGTGAAWVFTRSGGAWSQQGSKLVGSGAVGIANQGCSVAISADGGTAIVGGFRDDGDAGAAWVFTRSGGVWTQQGSKLVGSGGVRPSYGGESVALSADGNTAIVGGPNDNLGAGAAWVFTRSGGAWTQQGEKLIGVGAIGHTYQGKSVALSGDGNTAMVGAPFDNSFVGGSWVFTRSGGVWTQQGDKLVGTGAAKPAYQGMSVALSTDGGTALVGGPNDDSGGAVWVFTRSGGVWTQQGSKLVGEGAVSFGSQGYSVGISADGNTAIWGGSGDDGGTGAAWLFVRTGGAWLQKGSKLVGTGVFGPTPAQQGFSVALSGDGATAFIGGPGDDDKTGAAWVFTASTSSVWVPVTVHNPGLKETQWRSDLGLLNTGNGTANVQFTFHASGGVVSNTTYVPPGSQSILADIVAQLGASGQGALEVSSDQPLKVTSRTYNQVASDANCDPGGTQGQDYPAVRAGDGLSAGQIAYLAGLTENASYRCNIGLVNVGSDAAAVLVELLDGAGTRLADYTVNLAAGQWAQETQPFKSKAGQAAMDRGYAKITVQSGSGVFAFASVIDNLTNDPTTVAMQR